VASSSWEAALADIAARAGIDHKYVESAIAATLGTTPAPAPTPVEPVWPPTAPVVPVTPVIAVEPAVPVVPVTPALWTQPPDDLMAGVSTVYSAPGLGVTPAPAQPSEPEPETPVVIAPPVIIEPEPVTPVEPEPTVPFVPFTAHPTPQIELPELPRPAPGAASAASPVISIGGPGDEAATVQFERPALDTLDKLTTSPSTSVPKPAPKVEPEIKSDAADDFFGPTPSELVSSDEDDQATSTALAKVAEEDKPAKKARTKRFGRGKTVAVDDDDDAVAKGDAKTDSKADADQKDGETSKADAAAEKSAGKDKQSAKDNKEKKGLLSRLPGPAQWSIEIAVWVVAALILSTLIRLFVVQLFVVPSGSMENTLLTGDRIASLKYAQFQRGDIVVFSDPGGWLAGEPAPQISSVHRFFEKIGLLASTDQQYLVKRVIGLPGDRVQCCSNGHLTVNGVPIDESSYLKDPTAPASAFLFDVTVPAGRIFVLGDNRNSSADSRWHLCEANDQGLGMNGFVPIGDVVGPVRAVVLPFGRTGHRATPTSVFAQVPAATDPPPSVAKVSVSAGGPNGACHS